MSNTPLVTLAVPVYNGGKYIRRFLDSALNQIFEDFEIIFVDDMSTDDSIEVINEYIKVFPDKIQLYSLGFHSGYIGAVRNQTLKYARGKYVYMCDCDDILHPNGLNALVEAAEEYDCDLVCGWGVRVTVNSDDSFGRNITMYKKESKKADNREAIINGVEFWLRLIRRDLIDRVGAIPDDNLFDDVSYMPVLNSYANNIRFVDTVVYYYLRRDNSTSGTLRFEICEDSVRAEKYALEHCNPEYLDTVQYFVARRTLNNLKDRWIYLDIFVEWAREQMKWLPNNEFVKNDANLFNMIRWAANLTTDTIPFRVIVNGFGEKPSDERIKELAEKVFYQGSEVIVLSEENCDINSNQYVKKAYDDGDLEFVGKYFALKEISENGGIYIGSRIKILTYFNYYRYQNAIFFKLDEKNYSDHIFGAPAKNCVISDILSTYSVSWDKKERYMPLAETINIILTAKYEVPLNSNDQGFKYPVSVVSPNCGVMNINGGKAVCEHDFSDHAGDEDYVTLKRSTVEVLTGIHSRSARSSKEKQLQLELDDIKNSNTWKIILRIRRLGDSRIGPFLKKIFHGLLKIRAKFKKTNNTNGFA